MITRLPVRSRSNEVGDERDGELSDNGGSLLNQAKADPFSVIAKALLCTAHDPDIHVAPFDSYRC